MIPARRHRCPRSPGISHRVVLLIGREDLPVLASDGVEFAAHHRDSQSPARCRHRAPRLPPIDPGIVAPDSRHRLPGPKVPIPADDIELAVEGSGGGMMKSFGKRRSIPPQVTDRVIFLNGIGYATDEEHLKTADHVDPSGEGCCGHFGSLDRHRGSRTPAPMASGKSAKTGNEAGSAGSHRPAYGSRIHPSPLRVVDTSDPTLLQSLHGKGASRPDRDLLP